MAKTGKNKKSIENKLSLENDHFKWALEILEKHRKKRKTPGISRKLPFSNHNKKIE